MREKYQHGPLPLEKTVPGQTTLWFREQPGVFISTDAIAQYVKWGTTYSKDSIFGLIHDVRYVLRSMFQSKGHVVSIVYEDGYAYYPDVAAGQYITPAGFRPIPTLEGDAVTIVQLEGLFQGIRHSKVRPDIKTAKPILPHREYQYLLLLAQSYADHRGLNQLDAAHSLDITRDKVSSIRSKLKNDLELLTSGMWTINHFSRLCSLRMDGTSYLIQRTTALPVSAEASQESL